MKKILLLLCVLLCGASGAWAATLELTSSSQILNGSFYNAAGNSMAWGNWCTKCVTNSSPAVTLNFTDDLSGTGISNTSGYLGVYSTGTRTLTISMPDGCTISSYTFKGTPTADCKFTPAGGSEQTWTSGSEGSITVSDVNAQSTTIAFSGCSYDTHTECIINDVTLSIEYTSSTYDVKVLGVTNGTAGVTYQGTSYGNGSTITASNLAATDLTANAIEDNNASISISGTTITVTYTPDMDGLYVLNTSVAATTDAIVEGQWYVLTQIRGGESPAYDRGDTHTIYRAANSVTPSSLIVNKKAASDIDEYLIRFFKSGLGDAYGIQFATGNFWNGGNGVKSSASTSTSFLVYNATQESTSAGYTTGWAMNATTDGTTYGSLVDNNAAGYSLAYWGSGKITSGGNNVWQIYPVTIGELPTYTITINVKDGDDVVATTSFQGLEGVTYNVADYLAPGYVTYSPSTVTGAASAQTVNVTYAYSGPIVAGKNYIWNPTLKAPSNTTVMYNDEGTVRTNGTVDLTGPIDTKYIWTFEGNPFGYLLKNLASGTYLGGRTAAGGTMSLETPGASYFVPKYSGATYNLWYCTTYNYYIDRSSNQPYAYTSGQASAYTELYKVQFAYSDASYPGGLTIGSTTGCAAATDYYLTASATMTCNVAGWAISAYDGCTTLADALAADTDGTITLTLTQATSDITINVKEGDNTVYTKVIENAIAGNTYTIADEIGAIPFVTGYSTSEVTATESDQTLNVTYTSTLPFKTSTDPTASTAKQYYFKLRGYYMHGNEGTSKTEKGTDDTYMWTFGGNPFQGIQLYNVGKAGYAKVGSDSDNSVAEFVTDPFTFSINTTSQNSSGFELYVPGTVAYLNYRDGYLSTWLSNNSHNDAGSVLTVEEAEFHDMVVSNIKPYYDATGTGYFYLTDAAKTALEDAGYDAALTSCDLATYKALKAIVDANIKMPTEGYYRIKSYGSRTGETYAAYGTASNGTSKGLITVAAANKLTNLATVIKLTESDGSFTFSSQGLNLQSLKSNGTLPFPMGSGTGATVTFKLSSVPGWANILVSGSDYSSNRAGYLYESDWATPAVVANWGTDSEYNRWTIEEATTATVALNAGGDGSYYATLCVPFSFTPDANTKAYTIAVSGTEATPSEVSGEVAAGTPVLLKGSATSATLTIGTGYAASADATTGLTGTYLAKTITDADYVLGSDNNVVGFYLWDQTALGANRAYVKSTSGVKGFAINWGETGISTLVAPEAEQVIYNLAGQRVNKATKGIYIINGKKVLK